jgi:hypothetical protein
LKAGSFSIITLSYQERSQKGSFGPVQLQDVNQQLGYFKTRLPKMPLRRSYFAGFIYSGHFTDVASVPQ